MSVVAALLHWQTPRTVCCSNDSHVDIQYHMERDDISKMLYALFPQTAKVTTRVGGSPLDPTRIHTVFLALNKTL